MALVFAGLWFEAIDHHHPALDWAPHSLWHTLQQHFTVVLAGAAMMLAGGFMMTRGGMPDSATP